MLREEVEGGTRDALRVKRAAEHERLPGAGYPGVTETTRMPGRSSSDGGFALVWRIFEGKISQVGGIEGQS